MKAITLCTLLIQGIGSITNAQTITPDIITTSGGFFISANSSLSWTLGEPVMETDVAANSLLTQGFQQSQMSSVAVNKIADETDISVYPNPVSDLVVINIRSTENSILKAELTDVLGKMFFQDKLLQQITTIDMRTFADGLYFLKLLSEDGKIHKTVKVEKIN